MLAARDLALTDDIPAGLLEARNSTAVSYDMTLGEIGNLSPRENSQAVDEGLARLSELRVKQEQIANQIRKTSPHYASLKHPQPLSDFRTRAELDPGTLVLSYSVGRERTFLFALEPASAKGPGMTVRVLSGSEKTLRESVEAYRSILETPGRGPTASLQALNERGRLLYDALIKPADQLIAKYDRLLILPDGPLHTLPFGALVREVKNGKPQYLVEWKPIHTAVSATVYAEIKKGRKNAPRDPSVVVAAFGDPKYPKLPEAKVAVKRGESDDAESVDLLEEFDETEDPQLRSIARGGFRFEPLPASRKEVEEIASLYAPKSAAYVGSEATEERAKSIGKDVPLIHYACHAVINERFPLDSALVFSIPDKPKEGQDNGLLQAWEIFERVRIDADLVTLSACESGLGKEIAGEGLIGLTRAFQYAGARSVLASLWKVDDKATGELMKRFYGYLKAGRTKDEALRAAQIDLIRSSDYSHPRDWAAFQLNGDWR
jgi:CHAT domain-containing protein